MFLYDKYIKYFKKYNSKEAPFIPVLGVCLVMAPGFSHTSSHPNAGATLFPKLRGDSWYNREGAVSGGWGAVVIGRALFPFQTLSSQCGEGSDKGPRTPPSPGLDMLFWPTGSPS